MSGGGAKGAFEAGVLYGMYHGHENVGSTFDYDVITGVSAGAINALGLGVYKKD
jgi:predicted acylesterase/phospholipase RssA